MQRRHMARKGGEGGMSDTHGGKEGHDAPARYEIRIKGHLDARWADRFDGLRFAYESDGTTTLSGPVADQAALHGLLRRVRDLGMPLLSVVQVESPQADGRMSRRDTNRSRPKKETTP
jgi:hypothetical protein